MHVDGIIPQSAGLHTATQLAPSDHMEERSDGAKHSSSRPRQVLVVQLVLDLMFLLDVVLRYKMSWSTWRFLRHLSWFSLQTAGYSMGSMSQVSSLVRHEEGSTTSLTLWR